MSWTQNLILLPVLLPLLCGALLILINESRHQLKFAINMTSVLLMLAVAITLLVQADGDLWEGNIGVYLAGNWMAPFGIALVVDRLAALMLVMTAGMGAIALLYSMLRWSRIGVHFHSLFQFLLMGLNGAFLTHDLFNLFVFFEVMLAASYGLLLHGYNLNRIRAGMQFIAVNLVASLLFLIGVALIYAAAGTLNMADLSAKLGGLDQDDLMLLKIGASVLAIAFLIKSAMWPLGFWLPTTYSAASPPVAAMLVLMTKVGVYVLLRLWLLLFGEEGAEPGFGFEVLYWGGMFTLFFGAAGMLSTDQHGRLAGYAAIISSGTLLAVLGLDKPELLASGLYYLVSSTLAVAAYMLLIELLERSRNPVEAMLAITKEAFDFEEAPDQPVGVGIPGALAFVGLAFFACAIIIAGLPPLSGFIAKFSLLHGLLDGTGAEGVDLHSWLFGGLLLVVGFASIIALTRNGVRTLWASGAKPARLQPSEVASVSLYLLLAVVITFQATPVFDFLQRASTDLQQPANYIERVLNAPVLPGVLGDNP
tara:strand:+ start:6119 stop:7726 length:1608 start_codon:yes stop_codon:yes gene_type:complete